MFVSLYAVGFDDGESIIIPADSIEEATKIAEEKYPDREIGMVYFYEEVFVPELKLIK